MKKTSYYLLCLLLIISAGSCSKDKEVEPLPLIEDLELDNVSLHFGLWNLENEIKIVTGNGNYIVETGDELVATAYEKDNIIYITSISNGSTIISVKDAEEKTASIEITVNAVIPAIPNAIVWGYENETKTFDLFEAYKDEYTLNVVDKQYATAKIENNKLIINHKYGGQTDITVSDKRGVEAVFNVYSFSENELVIIPRVLTIKVGETVKLPILEDPANYSISFEAVKTNTSSRIITEMNKPVLEMTGLKKGSDLVTVEREIPRGHLTLRVTIVE